MNVLKIFVLLILLVFLGGCAVGNLSNLKHCYAPNRPSSPGCHYALKITQVKEDHAMGVIPMAVIQNNEDQQKKRGKDVDEFFLDYKNKTEQHEYRIGVEGANKLEKGLVYRFRSRYNATFNRPLERETDKKGNPLPGMEETDFKKELEKRQREEKY